MYMKRIMPVITNVLRYFNVFGPLLVSILLILFAALDIVHDISLAEGYAHIIFETIVFFLGMLLNLFFVHRITHSFQKLQDSHRSIETVLKTSEEENLSLKEEKRKFKEGLSRVIESQLKEWHLSPSEVEIGFLLLKGLSNKEIAEVRQTSESTVRLQCSSIYRKSNLGSRSELAAFFMEDML